MQGINNIVSHLYSLNNLPDLVKFVRQFEGYEAGEVVKLFYNGSDDAMYKFSGAIFGLSVQRVIGALNSGVAIKYNSA